MKKFELYLQVLTIVIFSLIISLPYLSNKFNFLHEKKTNENKADLQEPEFDFKHVNTFVKEYDAYYAENFNFRSTLIKFLGYFELETFHTSSVPNEVIPGKNHWLYEMKSAPNYKGLNAFSSEELSRLKKELEKRTAWAAKRGVKYYVAIVPNKMNVYPEFLPSQIISVRDVKRYDQVVKLNAPPFCNVIDVRKNILLHKNDGKELYQRTDDHWNDLGAYYGYEGIINRVKSDFPEIYCIPKDSFFSEIKMASGGLARMLNIEEKYQEKFISFQKKTVTAAYDGPLRNYERPAQVPDWDFQIVKINDSGKFKKCLFIRDSFTYLMVKYFQESFHESVFIHDEWKYRMREDLIINEKPDIVLNIILETEIHKLLDYPMEGEVDLPLERHISLKTKGGKYVCAESSNYLFANRDAASEWETFSLIWISKNKVALMAYTKKFVCVEVNSGSELTASRDIRGAWETFEIVNSPDGSVLLKGCNDKYFSIDEQTGKIYSNAASPSEATSFYIEYR
jgi:hypothetical protein